MLHNKLSEKMTEWLLLSVVTLMFIAMCAEADMYVPSFPEMVTYFSVTEDKIQLILSINFIGLCIASLISGPLSDAFGRRGILLGGMSLFLISSVACVFAESFQTMLFWRFLQGVSASVPMVVSCALFLDKYALEKASKLIGILNSVITGAMAAAPILGAWISSHFYWRLNFVVIAALAAICLLGTYFFIAETLPEKNRHRVTPPQVLKDYVTLICSFKFVGYCVLALLPFTAIVVYIANLSLIFMNHLGLTQTAFSFYQASTMGMYLIFSALSSFLISSKGMNFTRNLGGLLMIVGSVFLFLTAMLQPTSPVLICSAMGIFAAGGALVVGIFGMQALSVYPEMKGTGSAMLTSIRQLLAAGLVMISEITFNGSILPIAIIILSYVVVATLWYAIIHVKTPGRATVQTHNA